MATKPVAPLLVIVGETASGKSALALEVAERLNGEIVCADSWTVYRNFDIGTAKPTAEERRRIPHHLLDVADPAEGFSAAIFQRLALEAIDEIAGRDKLPMLVGGTGLYIDSIIYNYSFLPPSDPARRAELNAMSLGELLALANQSRLDTSSIDRRNKRRVIRLIENNGAQPTREALRSNTLIIGVKRDADELEERITRRVDSMLAAGLVDEVRKLGGRYGWDCEPMRAPGYRAFAAHIRGEIDQEEAIRVTVQQHLQLAKKQRTWFKRNNSIHWIENSDKITKTVDLFATLLNK